MDSSLRLSASDALKTLTIQRVRRETSVQLILLYRKAMEILFFRGEHAFNILLLLLYDTDTAAEFSSIYQKTIKGSPGSSLMGNPYSRMLISYTAYARPAPSFLQRCHNNSRPKCTQY